MNHSASTGTVRFFSTDRGWGFIVPDNPNSPGDVFCPAHSILERGNKPLERGERVSFHEEVDHSGRLRALNVRRLDET
jgi:cold shock protein